MTVAVGDLVQFKQDEQMKCWKDLPDTTWGMLKSWAPINYFLQTFSDYGTPRKKIPMTVVEIKKIRPTNSDVPYIKDMLTKEFAKVIVFTENGAITQAHKFWVMVDTITHFNGLTYEDELKIRLKNNLNGQK